VKTDTGYNGYANYETWNIVLWLYNDEGNYHDLRESLKPYMRCGNHVEDIKYIVRRIFHNGETSATPDGVWLDDKRIDWTEIHQVLNDDFGRD